MKTLIFSMIIGVVSCGSYGGGGGGGYHDFNEGYGGYGYNLRQPLIKFSNDLEIGYGNPNYRGLGQGHVFYGSPYNNAKGKGYNNNNYYKKPLVITKTIIEKPVVAPVYKPLPIYKNPHLPSYGNSHLSAYGPSYGPNVHYKPTEFSVEPSLSYGYSYKLVPTFAYAPTVSHLENIGYDPVPHYDYEHEPHY